MKAILVLMVRYLPAPQARTGLVEPTAAPRHQVPLLQEGSLPNWLEMSVQTSVAGCADPSLPTWTHLTLLIFCMITRMEEYLKVGEAW